MERIDGLGQPPCRRLDPILITHALGSSSERRDDNHRP
jgi:hypothetical protein